MFIYSRTNFVCSELNKCLPILDKIKIFYSILNEYSSNIGIWFFYLNLEYDFLSKLSFG